MENVDYPILIRGMYPILMHRLVGDVSNFTWVLVDWSPENPEINAMKPWEMLRGGSCVVAFLWKFILGWQANMNTYTRIYISMISMAFNLLSCWDYHVCLFKISEPLYMVSTKVPYLISCPSLWFITYWTLKKVQYHDHLLYLYILFLYIA